MAEKKYAQLVPMLVEKKDRLCKTILIGNFLFLRPVRKVTLQESTAFHEIHL